MAGERLVTWTENELGALAGIPSLKSLRGCVTFYQKPMTAEITSYESLKDPVRFPKLLGTNSKTVISSESYSIA
jgi:hypothetical protein